MELRVIEEKVRRQRGRRLLRCHYFFFLAAAFFAGFFAAAFFVAMRTSPPFRCLNVDCCVMYTRDCAASKIFVCRKCFAGESEVIWLGLVFSSKRVGEGETAVHRTRFSGVAALFPNVSTMVP